MPQTETEARRMGQKKNRLGAGHDEVRERNEGSLQKRFMDLHRSASSSSFKNAQDSDGASGKAYQTTLNRKACVTVQTGC